MFIRWKKISLYPVTSEHVVEDETKEKGVRRDA